MDDIKAELKALKRAVAALRNRIRSLEVERELPPQQTVDIRTMAQSIHRKVIAEHQEMVRRRKEREKDG